MHEVSFTFRGAEVTLGANQLFSRPPSVGFTDAGSHEMREIVGSIRSGRPWREEIERRFAPSKPWLRDIILSPKRRAFFPLLPPGLHRVLDIGCGWGQMTLPFASAGHKVTALEPGPHRLAFVQAAAEQDGVANHVAFVGADYLECEFRTRYDVILSIGVLEWVGAFHDAAEPRASQQQFLNRARKNLAPGGTLVLGIENRIGAKYLLGCPDDHLGVPGIGCLPAEIAARRWHATTGAKLRCFTYSESELRGMLREAGFAEIHFHAAFPDYKLPEMIVPITDGGCALAERLLRITAICDHNGFDGSSIPDELQSRIHAFLADTARLGTAHHFVPSFFVLAR